MRAEAAIIGLGVIIGGGALLGTALAGFADPVPRYPAGEDPAAWAGYAPAPAPSYTFVEAMPEDLAPPVPADGQLPPWLRAEQEAWTDPVPLFAEWQPDPYVVLAPPQHAEAEAWQASGAAATPEAADPADAAPALPPDPALRETSLSALY